MTQGIVHSELIYTVEGLQPGEEQLHNFTPPPHRFLNYWVSANPPRPGGQHDWARGEVMLVSVVHTYVVDNFNGNHENVALTVRNVGQAMTHFDVWQSWIDPA